jgi:hypothetical protein
MNKNGFLTALSASDKSEFGRKDFQSQSLPQKTFSAIWELEAEVNNGGFRQYFVNSSAESAHFVVEALERVRAPRTADVCRRAIAAAFPAGLPKAVELIQSDAADFSDEELQRLDGLDQEFFAYPDNLTDLLFAFVSSHPEEFGVVPND